MRKLALLILATLVTTISFAQVTTSSMSGKITDATGRPLIGAAVVAIHTPSGTQYGAAVDLNGSYRLLNMRPGGPYTVSVMMLGYQTSEYTGIELALGDNYILNADLFEAALGMDEIVVRGTGRDNMNTDRAGAVTTVNSKNIALQPTVSRSINDMLKVSPYASSTSNGLAIGGGNYRQSYVTVDGAAFNNAFGIGENMPSGGSPISLDALDQITVSVTPYDVRQSGFTGGSVNAVTRSGDNEFRGSAYTYLNSESLKGNNTGIGKFTKDEQSYKLYGFRLGGPIIKDKLFFFINGELERETKPGPSGRARANSTAPWGNDPNAAPNTNRPTIDEMDDIREYLISNYDYDPGEYQGYSFKSPGHKILARIDWNINHDHKFNIRFSHTGSKNLNNPTTSKNPIGSAYSGNRLQNSALYFSNSRYWQEQNFMSLAAELNSNFGKVANTLRVTYSHQDEPRSYDGAIFPMVDILEWDGTTNDKGEKNYTPFATFGTELFTYGNLRDVKTLVVTDEVNWNWGKHNMIGGIQYEFNHTENGYMQAGTGYYVYNSWDDFVNNASPQAFALTFNNYGEGTPATADFNYNQFSVYLQDKFDISNNFKLTAGLRVEVPFFPSIKDNYNPAFAERIFNGESYSTDQMPKARVQFSPRVGFNWDITGNRQHILRGGTGLFTGRLPFVWIVSAVGNSNVRQTTYYYANLNSNPAPSMIPGFHSNVNDIVKDLYGPNYKFDPENLAPPLSPTIMSKNLKMPTTWKTSLAYDVLLPGRILGTLEGIYSRNVQQVVITNMGLKDPVANGLKMSENDYRDLYSNGYWEYSSVNAAGKPTGEIRPFLLENGGKKGWHYSLTAKLEKNFNFGLSTMAAYTYSDARAVNDGIGDQVTSAWSTNTNSVNGTNSHDLGYGSYVSPHRFIFSVNYRKDYARNFASSIGLFYEGSNHGYNGNYTYTRFSYTYYESTNNTVGDFGAQNLIYVPKTKDELTFLDYTYRDAENQTQTYTAAQQAEDFWSYVNQDKYLKSRKGKYTERNGAVMPWRSRFDLKFMQDFYVTTKSGQRNTLQFGVDILNVANLLNKDWGNMKTIRNAQILQAIKNSAGNEVTGYYFRRDGTETLSKTYVKVGRYASTYSVQFSLRYIFN